MPEYSNPKIPEGINTSKIHPLTEFAILSTGVFACLIIITLILAFFAQYFARFIPFSAEASITQHIAENLSPKSVANRPIQDYLQSIANKVSTAQNLPKDMVITTHYLDDDMVNAFATLGGHIFITRGILEIMPHENALTMVLAHEIAHIKHRHPISLLGRGIIISLAIYAITGSSNNVFFGNILSDIGLLTSYSFNRSQESEADQEALQSLKIYYGHVNGASDLFTTLERFSGDLNPPQFLSTHPNNENRIKEIETIISDRHWSLQGELTQIPERIKKLILKNKNS